MQEIAPKKKLFICMSDIPYPPRKHGLSIRYYPILEHASRTFAIHLALISNEDINAEHVAELQKFCQKISIHRRKPTKPSFLKKILARVKSLTFFGKPYILVRYDEQEIIRFIKNETGGETYDIALNVSIANADLVRTQVKHKKYSLDLIDSLYSYFARSPKRSLLDYIDILTIRRWEQNQIRLANTACYISPLDRSVATGSLFDNEKLPVIPNGYFSDDYVTQRHNYGSFCLGFIGNMSYPPNIQAALRLAKIFRALVEKNKLDWTLALIGRLPSPEITALAQHQQILVTGTVDNIWPYVNGVDVFVFPMEIGSGQQNKLLEAMCAAKPIITTPLANSGIGALNEHHVIESVSDEELTGAILQLANNPQERDRLGAAAKEFVTERYSWQGIFKLLDKTLLHPSET